MDQEYEKLKERGSLFNTKEMLLTWADQYTIEKLCLDRLELIKQRFEVTGELLIGVSSGGPKDLLNLLNMLGSNKASYWNNQLAMMTKGIGMMNGEKKKIY